MAIINEAKWGIRNLDKTNHWERLKFDKYPHDKPVVICLGGNGTISENAANGMCKIAETFLQLLFKKNGVNRVYDHASIIGASYPIGNQPKTGKFSDDDITKFVDGFLIKRIQNENDELVPLNEACRRLSQITFLTHCSGHHEADRIMRAFYNELRTLGYSQQECDIMMMSMFEVSYAPLTYNSIIPALFVDSKQDKLLNKSWKETELSNNSNNTLNGVEIRYERYGDNLLSGSNTSNALFDAIHIYSSKLRNNVDEDEHNISMITRDGSWNATYEPNADCVSQMVAWALSRAVENGIDNKKSEKFLPKASLEELMQELVLIRNDFSAEQLMSKELS